MGHEGHQNSPNRNSLPLISLAIVIAQLVMAVSTSIGDTLTTRGVGRKPLFFAGLLTLPIRCVLILVWKDSGDMYLLSTQILDGIGGGIFGLMYPLLIADITFGTGRFNLAMGIVASFFGYVFVRCRKLKTSWRALLISYVLVHFAVSDRLCLTSWGS